MTRVYFLRHGQSIGNLEHRFLGHTDLDITPLGYKQAELVKEFFKNINIDVIYSSDLMRACNTVKPTADFKGLPIIKNKNLREILAGDWENQDISDLWENFGDTFSVWKTDIGNAVCPNGETVAELQKRILCEVNKIVSENKGKDILIATHATPIRVMLCHIKGIPLKNAKDIPWVTNASVTAVDFIEDGTYFLRTEGFDAYLGNNTSALSTRM